MASRKLLAAVPLPDDSIDSVRVCESSLTKICLSRIGCFGKPSLASFDRVAVDMPVDMLVDVEGQFEWLGEIRNRVAGAGEPTTCLAHWNKSSRSGALNAIRFSGQLAAVRCSYNERLGGLFYLSLSLSLFRL